MQLRGWSNNNKLQIKIAAYAMLVFTLMLITFVIKLGGIIKSVMPE